VVEVVPSEAVIASWAGRPVRLRTYSRSVPLPHDSSTLSAPSTPTTFLFDAPSRACSVPPNSSPMPCTNRAGSIPPSVSASIPERTSR
jgi:hypothetical protein